MAKTKYISPFFEQQDGGDGSVVGGGTGQGSITNQMSYEEWWVDIAWEGENTDADYNGDGVVNKADYDYYIANELWNG